MGRVNDEYGDEILDTVSHLKQSIDTLFTINKKIWLYQKKKLKTTERSGLLLSMKHPELLLTVYEILQQMDPIKRKEYGQMERIIEIEKWFLRSLSSMQKVWEKYSTWINGEACVKDMEEKYEKVWRKEPTKAKMFSIGKNVYFAIGLKREYCWKDVFSY